MGTSRLDDDGRALAYVGSLLLSFGLAVFGAIAYIFRALLKSASERRAANWPTASGEITTCDVKAIHGRYLDYAVGIVGYSYRMDDDYYSGYLTRQFWDEQQAWSFVDTFKDKSVLVHFNLSRPQSSVICEVDQPHVLPLPLEKRAHSSSQQRFDLVLAVLWSLRNVSDWAERMLQSKAREWPSTYATVEYAESAMIGDEPDLHWGGELHYSYLVDGSTYSSTYNLLAFDEADANDTVEEWRNRKVLVHYFPGDPSRSIFIPEEQDVSAANMVR